MMGNNRRVQSVYMLEAVMPILRAAIIVLVVTFSSPLVFGCSCTNSTPIQKTSQSYRNRAVFTARIVQLMGKTYNWDGKRYSSQALAIVHERYWGLPWYWPKIVLLDGRYPCDTVMADGEDYLVSGRRSRYGVVEVNLCSRTQPLKTAQLDLRTLDGSHCAGPGGTIIGHVVDWTVAGRERLPARNASMTFLDENGNTYTAQSDDNGIYELRHLPAGPYTLESHLSQGRYAASGPVSVKEGLCTEMPVSIRNYSVSGRLMPGIDQYVNVYLAEVSSHSEGRNPVSIEPDGRFYFSNVAPGKYLLSLTTTAQRAVGAGSEIYYPGTPRRAQAARITVTDHTYARSLDFNPSSLPLVPIPVVLEPPVESGRFSWRFELEDSSHVIRGEKWSAGGSVVLLYGVRGASYGISLYGYSNQPMDYADCRSEVTPITAKPGLKPIHIAVPDGCR